VSSKNADFKKIYDSVRAFRNEEYLWFQVAEYAFDNFMIRARARG
jgi:TRAP-type mannitol/chloroaromatic compound transport system substrate-binding protein